MSDQRRHAWMSKDLGALVALGILSAAAAGCIGPPSCTDFERTKRSVALNSVSLANDDSFTIPRRGHFASCRTFCAVESGVESVHEAIPTLRGHLLERRKFRDGADRITEQDTVLIMKEESVASVAHPIGAVVGAKCAGRDGGRDVGSRGGQAGGGG